MKFILRLFLIALASFSILLVDSCREKEETCTTRTTTIQNDVRSIVAIDSFIQGYDSDSALVNWQVFSIILDLKPTKTIEEFKKGSCGVGQKPGIITSAYATPPALPDQTLIRLNVPFIHAKVLTDKIYNSRLGTNVTIPCSEISKRQSINMVSLLTDIEELEFRLSQFDEDPPAKQTLNFTIDDLPDQSDTFRFTIHLEDANGVVYESTTDPIFIRSE